MRLGKVQIGHSYVVDLDDKDMVDHAKDALYEDLMNAVKYDELPSNIEAVNAPDASEGDIPDFLTERDDD